MNPNSAPKAATPPPELTMERFLEELEKERADLAAEAARKKEEAESGVRSEIKAHNRARSVLIHTRTCIRKWDKDEAKAALTNGIMTKVIDGEAVADPYYTASKTLTLPERDTFLSKEFKFPPAYAAPSKPVVVESAASSIKARYRQLREVECMMWHFKLEWIADVVMRVRIAKLIWWDLASVLKKQNCVLTELVETPITMAQIQSYSVEQVAFELWRLGWPASMAAERAEFAQK